jgi:predicted enzyme related to lactoylglutathione lyase
MKRVEHFDLYADEPERASKFYSDVFDWTIQKWDGPMDYWMVMTGSSDQPGIDGGISKRQDPADHTVNTIGVPSVDEFTEKITASGGQILAPKMAIPGVGWFALCTDTEGNKFGLMEEDTSAK